MATLGLIEYKDASPEVRAVYDDIMATRKTDWINNFWKALAHDPATLKRTWEDIKQIMGPGALDPLTKELVYLAVSVSNQCGYCIASHTAGARKQGHDRCHVQGAHGGGWNGERDQSTGGGIPGGDRRQVQGLGEPMAHELTTSYLRDSLSLFRNYKTLAERAMAQVTDEQLFAVLDGEMNCIAIIVKHMAGNMRSRWMDFLTSDGEKADRKRDTEFENPPKTRAALMTLWEDGWNNVFNALEPLSDVDLDRTVGIRGEPHSVMQAVNRQIAHYAYHCGQIVFLAKHLQATQWKPLTVPRGKSEEFNQRVAAKEIR